MSYGKCIFAVMDWIHYRGNHTIGMPVDCAYHYHVWKSMNRENNYKFSNTMQYRLKQDYNTPGCFVPAGTIGEYHDGYHMFYGNTGLSVQSWTDQCVKNCPDWFEPVEERDPYLRAVAIISGTTGSPKQKAEALKDKFIMVPMDKATHHIAQFHGPYKLVTVEIPDDCVVHANTSAASSLDQLYLTILRKP